MDTLPGRTWKERNFRPQLINPVFLCHSGRKEGGGGGGGGGMQWTRNFWSGACGSVFQTMILFQTKVCNLKYRPIFILSDQAVSNRYPILDTTASNPYLWRLTYLCSLYREINTPPPPPPLPSTHTQVGSAIFKPTLQC